MIRESVYSELFLEFLSTFSLEKGLGSFYKPNTMKFRLSGTQFSFSLVEFALNCGFYNLSFTTSSEYEHTLIDLGFEISLIGEKLGLRMLMLIMILG